VLTKVQKNELVKNVKLVLENSHPGLIRIGRTKAYADERILRLFRTDDRFRFLDQVPEAKKIIDDFFKE